MDHNDKVIPFLAPARTTGGPKASTRLIVNVGKQRVAFDFSCRATVLSRRTVPDGNTAPRNVKEMKKP